MTAHGYLVWINRETGEVVMCAEIGEPISTAPGPEDFFTISGRRDTQLLPPCRAALGCDAEVHRLCWPGPNRDEP